MSSRYGLAKKYIEKVTAAGGHWVSPVDELD